MLYVVIDKSNIVLEVIPEYDERLPNIPIKNRYEKEFLDKCIVIDDNTPCKIGWIFDKDTNSFYEPTTPSPSFTLKEAISYKCEETNLACEIAIVDGFDFNGLHYSLTANDQSNLISLSALSQAQKDVPYHADGEECRFYTVDEFNTLVGAATVHKTHHTTYCNLLKMMVKGMSDTEDVYAVKYGVTELEGEYAERYNEIMGAFGT